MIKLKKLLLEKTLYHGTTVDNIKHIERYGLIPQRGDFVSNAYGGEYDSEEDFENSIPELTFAADKKTLDSAVTAATHHIAKKLDKGFHDVTDLDFIRYAAIIKIYDGDLEFNQRPANDDNYYGQYPTSVEPGDYYSEEGSGADEILTGKPLLRLLKRYRLWPRKYGDDTVEKTTNQKRDFLIKICLKGPMKSHLSKAEIIGRIKEMDIAKINQLYHKYQKYD
jgi:hypothetical protein